MPYYYLVASLPGLSLDRPPPISPEELVGMSEGRLSRSDMADVRRIVEGRPEEVAHPAFRGYVAQDTQLRNALARIRATRTGVDPSGFERPVAGFHPEVDKVAGEAMAMTDPLERETMLDRFRFRLLDELAFPSSFESIAVLAYAAKLLLVERRESFDEERGLKTLHRIVDERVEKVSL